MTNCWNLHPLSFSSSSKLLLDDHLVWCERHFQFHFYFMTNYHFQFYTLFTITWWPAGKMWKASSFRGKCSGSPDSARVAPHRSWDIIYILLEICFTKNIWEHVYQYVFEWEIWTSQSICIWGGNMNITSKNGWHFFICCSTDVLIISQHFWFLNIFLQGEVWKYLQ